jgi:hypothetical protein
MHGEVYRTCRANINSVYDIIHVNIKLVHKQLQLPQLFLLTVCNSLFKVAVCA